MKQRLLLITPVILLFSFTLFAQQDRTPTNATLFQQAEYMIEVPSIAEQIATGQFLPAEDITKEVNPKRQDANKAVPGKGLPKGPDPLWNPLAAPAQVKSSGPIISFETASANITPTDPTGAVGPDHYVNAWNTSFRIWDKEGEALTPAASLGTIFPGETAGDPIVIYDPFADRFLITEFTFMNGFLVAVCQGSDPVNDGWYTYYFSTNTFPDYPKFTLWSDGYYITANKNSSSAGTSEVVFALERDKMLEGDPDALMIGFPLPGITTSGFYSPLGFNVNGSEMPPEGGAPIVYLQDDVWSGVSTDHLKIWTIDVDWETPDNSTISDAQELETTPFDGLFDGGSFSNLPQPSGPDLDALQATIMYMAQYRRFPGYNTVVFNFVVDLDGNDDYSGIRWYELRQSEDGEPWEIFQEGTYSQPDGHSAYAGNMCMDVDGNIALAYTTVSEDQYPSLRYTGRFATDLAGEMTIAEETYAEGTQSDPSFRYGDYSQMTIDPVDDKTFWSTGEYFTGGTRKNQVGAFKFAPDLANDVGIISIDSPTDGTLTDSEPIVVTIRNFGTEIQENIPVSFQIDEEDAITENFEGPLDPVSVAQYTFTATGDLSNVGQTYSIKAYTALDIDENLINDTLVSQATHLYPNDLGITQIIEPVGGPDLTESEPITVTVKNYGGEPQSNFDLTYTLDEGEPVTEQAEGPIEAASTLTYTFETLGDFSLLGDHFLEAYTNLPEDSDTSNDTVEVIITKNLCEPEQNCELGDGIAVLELGTIFNESGCDPEGYGDYSDMVIELDQGSDNKLTITTGYGSQYVKVWIDFNDNFVFELEEVVVDDFVIADGQGSGSYTDTIPLTIALGAPLGEHLFRAKTNWNSGVPDDPCEETTYGETEDYTVSIDVPVGIENPNREPNNLVITQTGYNHFMVTFNAINNREPLIVSVHNLQGHTLIQNRVYGVNGRYEYDFDMSYASPGVYLLRLGNNKFGKVKRFVVE